MAWLIAKTRHSPRNTAPISVLL